jgi:hypothetical protein
MQPRGGREALALLALAAGACGTGTRTTRADAPTAGAGGALSARFAAAATCSSAATPPEFAGDGVVRAFRAAEQRPEAWRRLAVGLDERGRTRVVTAIAGRVSAGARADSAEWVRVTFDSGGRLVGGFHARGVAGEPDRPPLLSGDSAAAVALADALRRVCGA